MREEDDIIAAAQGLVQGGAVSSSLGLTVAQRSVLQAIEVLAQVQQYAEAASAAIRSQEQQQQRRSVGGPSGGPEEVSELQHPSNLHRLLRNHLSSETAPVPRT